MKIWKALCLIFSPFYLFAQNNLGPRLTAMGESGAAVRDIWSIQANPAGISIINTPSTSLSYAKHLFSNEVSTQAFVAVIPFKNNFAGLSFERYGFSAYNESKIGFAYAKKFGTHLSIAINTNYHQLKISNYGSSAGFSIDVGAIYTIDKEFTIGAFVNNPFKQSYNKTEISTNIPTVFNIGASYSVSDKVLIATTLSKNLVEKIDVKLGIDYKILDVLSLRGGLSKNPFKQYVGFGLNYKKFLLDMASTYDANLGYAPQIGIGYAF